MRRRSPRPRVAPRTRFEFYSLYVGPRKGGGTLASQTSEELAARFAQIARRYCEFVEAAAGLEERERLLRARLHLSELVHVACQLPAGDPDGPDICDEASAPTGWPGFGPFDVYHEVYDPYDAEPLVCGSLTDDVLDVYADLRRGLIAFDAGFVGWAVWEWKFHFDSHWGDHAVDALRALQRACVGGGL